MKIYSNVVWCVCVIFEQDISEGLFKLQVGSQRHWNLYAKSFLDYGERWSERESPLL
jgi:hypothetical protein